VHTERAILVAARLAAGLVVAVFVTGALAPASAATPPHVVLESQRANTDACAICHRAHAANAVVPYRMFESAEMTGSSLVLSTDPASGDVQLCFACHGQGQLGSNKDIQTNYLKTSVHALAPATAPYGPSPLYCSTCHDSHGSARVTTDVPYPRLLRSFEGTTPVYTGEAYCATCHTAAAATAMGERFASLEVYLTTGHYSGLSTPTSGTGIRCSWCHEPHGSAVAPLLVASIVPTAVPTTFTVTADNRTFCIACHVPASATWEGSATYAASGHGSSTATVSITATWVPAGSRRVGECQVCHAPMGRNDGTGHAIPKLLDAKGRVQCESCHVSGGVAAVETSSQARPVENARTLAVVYAPANGTTKGRVALYGVAASGNTTLAGPRQFAPTDGTGPSTVGDVDGDTHPELVVASGRVLTVYDEDPLSGLESQPTTYSIPATVAVIAVADIVDNTLPGYSEIAVVDIDGNFSLYILIAHDVSSLTAVGTPVSVGAAGPWGIATGNLQYSGMTAVVTDEGGGAVYALYDNGSGGVSMNGFALGGSPVAPAIGELWNTSSGNEMVVCDSVSTTENVRIYSSAGGLLQGYLVTAGDGVPTASAIGDVLWGAPDGSGLAEFAIAFANASGDSTVVVVPQYLGSPGLSHEDSTTVVTGAGHSTASLLIGDVDGDTHAELVAGNGGTWDPVDSSWVAPSVQVWRADATTGQSFLTADRYLGGGTEYAGAAPSLALADLGPIIPSRHPIDEVAPAAHVSTEAAPFTRHVTCSDCHNTHEGNTAAGVAPAVPGPLAGAWGVVGPATARAGTQYAICYKCHSSYVALGGRQDVAAQFNTASASRHAVEVQSTSTIPAATFVGGWTQDSILYCTDCHGDSALSGAQARELHESPSAPLLNAPYLGIDPGASAVLCYECHADTVYAMGNTDAGVGMSWFQESAPNDVRLHSFHVAGSGGKGLSCSACHVSHGSAAYTHLLRSDIGFAPDLVLPHVGSCTNNCHGPAVPGFTGRTRGWPTQP
jgi:hypothetical protein